RQEFAGRYFCPLPRQQVGVQAKHRQAVQGTPDCYRQGWYSFAVVIFYRRESRLHPEHTPRKMEHDMSYELSAEQRADILALDADERFDYFVTMVRETGELWSLADQDEWLVLRADDEEFLPLWPHPDLAADWAGEQETAKPKAIPLAV